MATKIFTRRGIILFSCIGLFLSSPIYSIKKIIQKENSLITRSLYLQTKYPRIELPQDISLSEKLEYKHAEEILTEDKKIQDAIIEGRMDSGLHIQEVRVTAKYKFAPEYKGKVDVDFLIKIPKELLSPKWRITLSPKLLHNDSIVDLEKVFVKGRDFYEMQKSSYANYNAYLNSIVQEEKYDSAFLDKKAIGKDIQNIQNQFYAKYNSDWQKQKDYLDQLDSWNKMQNYFVSKEKEEIANLHATYGRKVIEEKYNRLRQGKDSTGVYSKYMRKFNEEKLKITKHWEERRENAQKLKPQDGKAGVALTHIKGRPFSSQDSLELAKTRYDLIAISQNEMKKEQKEEVFKEMVKFPYEDSDTSGLKLRLDTIVDSNNNFTFLYKQSYRLTPGLKKIRIYMESKFDATDFSSYLSSKNDTLTYNIATLAQLADTTLLYKTYKVTREMDLNSQALVKYLPKEPFFHINYKDNKKQVSQLEEAISYFLNKKEVYVIDSVKVELQARSWATDNWEDNYRISQDQSNTLKNYLAVKYKDSLSADVKFSSLADGENWNVLVSAIKKSNKIQNKEQIVSILGRAAIPDKAKDEIRKRYRKDYMYICDSIYPSIEQTIITVSAHRTDLSKDLGYEMRKDYKGDEYAEGVRLLLEREYEKALPLLAKEGGYNAALCLTCLGYNAQAYQEIAKIDQNKRNGNEEYLLAILSNRLKREDEALQHLKNAFQLDESKKLRARIDYEILELVQKYNIDLR